MEQGAASSRSAEIARKTNETDIKLSLNVDGTGVSEIETDVPFLNHMLDLFTKHGQFDLKLQAAGDVDIDDHHTVEDIGICLGSVLREALGSKKGIKRLSLIHI
ncbi:MAG: imidazoleglycerol-phosphate dehydratase, partial [Anaerolineae bacterium]|nr:imidazoleglycerol-phosphate dehydratase [Anaerolineae bacterium]